jgi:hypothetical protein
MPAALPVGQCLNFTSSLGYNSFFSSHKQLGSERVDLSRAPGVPRALRMGAAESKAADQGIVTVSTCASGSSRIGARTAAADADSLLAHLLALRALVPDVETRVARSDPSSVWRDIESAKQLGADTRELAAAVGELLGAYRAWHADVRKGGAPGEHLRHKGAQNPSESSCDNSEGAAAQPGQHTRGGQGQGHLPRAGRHSKGGLGKPGQARPPSAPRARALTCGPLVAPWQRARAVCTNQDYINRAVDQAEAKAAKALAHVRAQLQRLRALNSALKEAAGLPALLEEVASQTAALQARCDALAAGLPPL